MVVVYMVHVVWGGVGVGVGVGVLGVLVWYAVVWGLSFLVQGWGGAAGLLGLLLAVHLYGLGRVGWVWSCVGCGLGYCGR
jgi:hypothetical protein